ncbi:MAG: protease complex subunit PrcB family protein, partial [Bacillota bacterium]
FWWTWEVPFEAGETREVRNTYWVKNHYWSNGQVLAGYILTTGSYWKGPIGKARVVFRFEGVLPGDLVQIFPETYRFEGNDLVWEWTGLEPQEDIEIIFNTRRWPETPVKREVVGEKYPQSYLARGIRAYEEVRGEPYFELDRREKYQGIWPVYFHGDEQYSPEREIPGWEKFLAGFPGHPAADDAAYRLARCYEIEGRWAEALNALQRALTLPDGDMRYHIAGRLIYILDVRMTRDQLKELSSPALDPPLRPLADYTLAVKELRRDDYRQAALALEEFLKKYSEAEIQDLSPFGRLHTSQNYDFRGEIEKQLARVREIAGLKEQWEGSKDPSVLYNLAAAIYHNQMTYYNHLWAGQRQWYNWLGYINDTAEGRAPAEMAAFAREMINYGHSLDYFRQVYDDPSSPPRLKEKALYSQGLCYTGLYDWGQDAWFVFNKSEVKQNIIAVYNKFISEYQASPMADGALLALGAYTGEAHYLEKIIKDYPQGGMADKARQLLEEMKSPYYSYSGRLYGSPVPFKVLARGDRLDPDFQLSAPGGLPEEVRKWAAANGGHPFAGSMTDGEWSYILIAAGERPTAGYGVKIVNIYDDGQGRLKVRYRVDGPPPGQVSAQVITYPFILVRIPAGSAALEFTEEG